MIKKMSAIGWIIVFAWAHQATASVNDIVCGKLANPYGPYDYRTDKQELPVVEAHHLTPEVLNLISGKTGVFPGGDLDYTLRAFPNHPQALMAMMRLGERDKMERPKGAKYSVECYIYRAWRFRENDPTVRMIYATFLSKRGRGSEALAHLEDALTMGDESANLDYNLGLIYCDLKKYDQALSYAHKAYLNGFPLPGLREKLKKAGKWKDPVIPVEGETESKVESKD